MPLQNKIEKKIASILFHSSQRTFWTQYSILDCFLFLLWKKNKEQIAYMSEVVDESGKTQTDNQKNRHIYDQYL